MTPTPCARWEDARTVRRYVGVGHVNGERARLPHIGLLAAVVTVGLAGAASAAYQLAGRRAAHANVEPAPLAVRLRAAVTPAHVPYGGTVRVTGTVRDRAGQPVAGQVVEVVAARVDAPDAPAVVGTPTTDAHGHLSVPLRPAAGSTVWLRFAGDRVLAAGTSRPVRVGVAQRVRVAATTRTAGSGWATTITGAVRPGRAGQPIRLDRRDARGWHTESVGRLTRASTFAFTVRHARGGTYGYRVVRPADVAFDAGSAPYTLRLAARRLPRPPTRSPATRASVGPAGRLLVTGDSLAYYLGQQLATARGRRPTTVESRPSSGLARPDYFDWTAFARKQVASGAPGAVVVFVGANDCQPLRAGGTGAWTQVGSTRWVAEYRRRAAGLMRAYTGDAKRPVYWVGLPIARTASIAACYRQLNGATAAAARDVRGVTWVDSWSVYAVHGRYADRVGGVLARQDDGIHLTFPGTRLLTRKMLGVLRP
jgi:lysophospholipase L1-like esterase